VHRNGVGLARLVMDPAARRVLEAAAAPFVQGMWSAAEVLEREVSDVDVARFNRALAMAGRRVPELNELLAETRSLVEQASGQSFGAALRDGQKAPSRRKRSKG
jgi:hypothetical protein